MGVSDREWARRQPYKEFAVFEPFVVKMIVVMNVVVFFLEFMMRDPNGYSMATAQGAYTYYQTFNLGEVWRLITYQFLHANVQHLLFNMLVLWFFGNVVERIFGPVKLVLFYLVCGIAAALFSSALSSMGLCAPNFIDSSTGELVSWKIIPMVGASGSIYGIIAAAAILFPHARVQLLFPPIELSVRVFALAILAMATVFIVFNWNNAGGEAGHMGGMFMGFILTMSLIGLRKIPGPGMLM